MSTNYIVEYNENLSELCRALDNGMNAMHRHYRDAHGTDKSSRWLDFKLRWAYKFAYYFRISLARWMDKHASRTVERDGVTLELDWSKMHGNDIDYAFEMAEYEKLESEV